MNISFQSLRTKFNHFFDSWWFSRPGITNNLIYMPTPVYEELLPGAPRSLDTMSGPATRNTAYAVGKGWALGAQILAEFVTANRTLSLTGWKCLLTHFKCSTEKFPIKFLRSYFILIESILSKYILYLSIHI